VLTEAPRRRARLGHRDRPRRRSRRSPIPPPRRRSSTPPAAIAATFVNAALAALAEVDGDDVHALMLKELGSSSPDESGAAARYFRSHRDESVVGELLRLARHGGARGARRRCRRSWPSAATPRGAGSRRWPARRARRKSIALQSWRRCRAGTTRRGRSTSRILKNGGPAAQVALGVLANDGLARSAPRARRRRAQRRRNDRSIEAMTALAPSAAIRSRCARSRISPRTARTRRWKNQALICDGHERLIPARTATLTRALASKDPDTQKTAVHAMSMVRGPEAEKAILDLTTSSDASLRVAAVRAPGAHGIAADGRAATRSSRTILPDPQRRAHGVLGAGDRRAPTRRRRSPKIR